jgi:hypothetical protein
MASAILISGAGQIGSRHLQGLVKCKIPLRIYIHDIHKESLAIAKQRWDEVCNQEQTHELSIHASLNSMPQNVDIAIVATAADVRAEVVAKICNRINVRHWVLEKVLTQGQADLDKLLLQIGTDSKVWVNIPRRMMPWYKEIRSLLGLKQPLALNIQGGGWGLACNSAHFLDLCAWWTGETLSRIDSTQLDLIWFESKRPGFWEINGTLKAYYSGGSKAILSATKGANSISIDVSDGDQSWTINEVNGIAQKSDGIVIKGKPLYQSEMTGPLVESILKTGRCDLPTIKEASDVHRIFIQTLVKHWEQAGNPDAAYVPIT